LEKRSLKVQNRGKKDGSEKFNYHPENEADSVGGAKETPGGFHSGNEKQRGPPKK